MLSEILLISVTGSVGFLLFAMLFFVAWGFAGRWMLQNPYKISPGGPLSRIGRFQIALVGTFLVFGGGAGFTHELASLIGLPDWLSSLAAEVGGVISAVWVCKESRKCLKTKLTI